LKNLPLGISTLSKLLENNCVYVDKTEYAYKLTSQSGAFFLSRPRRFGKSLFVDILKEILQILSSFDMDAHNPITLLFQTGYLTIEKTFIQDGRLAFRLKIPNKEVQLSLGIYFIKDDVRK
jgi:hypothetical protein